MKSALRFLALTIQIAGALVLVYCAFVFVHAQAFQAYTKWLFDQALWNRQSAIQRYSESPVSLPLFSDRTVPELDSLIGRIEIPRLRLSTMILEGAAERQLKLGAGHVSGTALPGETGNVVIAAHRDTFFGPLRKISKNDQIVLTTLSGSFQYIVESVQITDPDNTAALQPSAEPALTLVTCYPFTFVGSAPQRFIVRARKVGYEGQGIRSDPQVIEGRWPR